jgi:predicted MFS family arabinose efflux permease
MVVFLAGCVWSIKAKTFHSLVASRIVASFAGGSIDSLGPAVVAGKLPGVFYVEMIWLLMRT